MLSTSIQLLMLRHLALIKSGIQSVKRKCEGGKGKGGGGGGGGVEIRVPL